MGAEAARGLRPRLFQEVGTKRFALSALGAMAALLFAATVPTACQLSIGPGDTTSTTGAAATTQAQTTVATLPSTSAFTTTAPGQPVTLNPQPTHVRPTIGPKTTKTTEPPPSPATPLPPGETTTSFILTPITAEAIPTIWTYNPDNYPLILGAWD